MCLPFSLAAFPRRITQVEEGMKRTATVCPDWWLHTNTDMQALPVAFRLSLHYLSAQHLIALPFAPLFLLYRTSQHLHPLAFIPSSPAPHPLILEYSNFCSPLLPARVFNCWISCSCFLSHPQCLNAPFFVPLFFLFHIS